MTRSANYLMSGAAHLPYVVVSLRSLRNHYDGQVRVWAYPESIDYVRKICSDKRLDAEARLWEPTFVGKNGQFLQKQIVLNQSEDDLSLYLDADTIVKGSIDPLFDHIQHHGFLATQFCTWMCHFRTIRGRVSRLVDREGIDQDAVMRIMNGGIYPSVNGGVFGHKKGDPTLLEWHQASLAVRDLFICDETALHAFVSRKPNPIQVMTGGRFNCSPKYQPESLTDSDVAIWHGHGDSFVRPTKSKKGYELWWPLYQECLQQNVGLIQEWNDEVTPSNRFLVELKEQVSA